VSRTIIDVRPAAIETPEKAVPAVIVVWCIGFVMSMVCDDDTFAVVTSGCRLV